MQRIAHFVGLATLGLLLALGVAHAGRNESSFILFVDDDRTTMSGDISEIERVKKLREGDERLLWFRTGGKEYLVRDPATIAEVEAQWKPVDTLGSQQGILGAKQGILGTKQGALGARQGALGARLGGLATRIAGLELQEDSAASAGEREAAAKQRAAAQRELREVQAKMREIGEQMEELGKQMNVLGKQMDMLGKQLDAASKKATTESNATFARAVSSGVARPVK